MSTSSRAGSQSPRQSLIVDFQSRRTDTFRSIDKLPPYNQPYPHTTDGILRQDLVENAENRDEGILQVREQELPRKVVNIVMHACHNGDPTEVMEQWGRDMMDALWVEDGWNLLDAGNWVKVKKELDQLDQMLMENEKVKVSASFSDRLRC